MLHKFCNLFIAVIVSSVFWPLTVHAVVGLAPYYKAGTLNMSAKDASEEVKKALKNGGFEIIGEYNPEENLEMVVLVYTRADLLSTTSLVKDRGLLATPLKAGIMEKNGASTITMLNPEYLFRGYLRKEFFKYEKPLLKVNDDAKFVFTSFGSLKPFGGGLTEKELEKYHYMVGMEYFSDPVTLRTFGSFEEGLMVIEANIAEGKGGTEKVFSIIDDKNKTAVFGIALKDPQLGEKFFLPIIGNEHLAAMPYELILQDRKATMLHGRFRIALHWPSLTMATFSKIISTPGDIEETLEGLVK